MKFKGPPPGLPPQLFDSDEDEEEDEGRDERRERSKRVRFGEEPTKRRGGEEERGEYDYEGEEDEDYAPVESEFIHSFILGKIIHLKFPRSYSTLAINPSSSKEWEYILHNKSHPWPLQ